MLALKETESIIEYLNVQTAMQGMRKIIQEYFFLFPILCPEILVYYDTFCWCLGGELVS